MRSLPVPNLHVRAVVEACAESVQDQTIKGNLAAVCAALEGYEAEYLGRGPMMTLFEIGKTNVVGGVFDKDAMKKLYRDTFVKSVRTRAMYDRIKSAPQHSICPLCSQRTVSTLDHYLAQANHSAFTLVPANLVPACAECNKDKLDREADAAGDQSFHPYFENCDDFRWLRATVEHGAPACVSFSVEVSPAWSPDKAGRVRVHFKTLKLGSLYASHAAVEITNIRLMLRRLLAAGSSNDVAELLADQALSSREAHPNSWRTATYDALASSAWFCQGGFDA